MNFISWWCSAVLWSGIGRSAWRQISMINARPQDERSCLRDEKWGVRLVCQTTDNHPMIYIRNPWIHQLDWADKLSYWSVQDFSTPQTPVNNNKLGPARGLERSVIKTYRCQDTPSVIPSFKFKYAEIRLGAYYSLISFWKAATDYVPFRWTRGWNGGVEVYFLAVWAYSTHFSPNCREFMLLAPKGFLQRSS